MPMHQNIEAAIEILKDPKGFHWDVILLLRDKGKTTWDDEANAQRQCLLILHALINYNRNACNTLLGSIGELPATLEHTRDNPPFNSAMMEIIHKRLSVTLVTDLILRHEVKAKQIDGFLKHLDLLHGFNKINDIEILLRTLIVKETGMVTSTNSLEDSKAKSEAKDDDGNTEEKKDELEKKKEDDNTKEIKGKLEQKEDQSQAHEGHHLSSTLTS